MNLAIPADMKKGLRQPRSREPEKWAVGDTIAQARLTVVPPNGPTRGVLQAGYLSILIQQIVA